MLTNTGEMHYFATPEETPILMQELVAWYNEARHNPLIHPTVLAAFMHHRFVAIHPFGDGNGRLGRMLMNLILVKNHFPPAIIQLKERTVYYSALKQADKNEFAPLVEFVAQASLDSMNLYLKAARGESIEDDEDLRKEIELFKRSLDKEITIRSVDTVNTVVANVFLPMIEMAEAQFVQFDELFLQKKAGYFFKNKHDFNSIYLHQLNNMWYYTLKEVDVMQTIEFRFSAVWTGFKKAIQELKLESNIQVVLGRIDYQIVAIKYSIFEGNQISESVVLLSKRYDEPITTFEINEVVKKAVRFTFEYLKQTIDTRNKAQ